MAGGTVPSDRILVVNTRSSSLKLRVLGRETRAVLARLIPSNYLRTW